MDKVIIRDLRVNGIIGIYPQERVRPQEMVINVILYTDVHQAAVLDEISECVDYQKAANLLKAHAETARRQTVEALTEDLAQLCLAMPGVFGVQIRVEKTQAIPFTAAVGVEIERMKG